MELSEILCNDSKRSVEVLNEFVAHQVWRQQEFFDIL